MPDSMNEAVITLSLFALAVYFTVLMLRDLHGYLLFRRIRRTAILTWPARTSYLPFLVALGITSAAVAVINQYQQRPLHHVYSQGIMALYFTLVTPLMARIPLGFYADGVWADRGFLPYARIGRMAFREAPEIVLVLLSRGPRPRPFRLPVPADDYGAARKLLADKAREHVLVVEQGLLGL